MPIQNGNPNFSNKIDLCAIDSIKSLNSAKYEPGTNQKDHNKLIQLDTEKGTLPFGHVVE